ncbi:MAG: class E sortase [Actinomycetota bacterium]|nr:class E sortase [Actinomycetota bacterium]
MRKFVLTITSMVLVGAGVVLAAFFFLNSGVSTTATNSNEPEGFNVPDIGTSQDEQAAGGPEDKTLTVTVPKMERIKEADIPDAEGDDEEALKNYAGLHLKGTGFPWQEEANVYMAGHRLGYPGTDSFLAFYDQDNIENGDEIYVTDANGKQYTYRVFENLVVNPTDLWVTEPIAGKNILTLQTCTLPYYSQRLITRAELVEEV